MTELSLQQVIITPEQIFQYELLIETIMDARGCTEPEAVEYLNKKKQKKIRKIEKKLSRAKAKKNFMLSGHPHARTVYENRFRSKTLTKYYLNVECTQFTIGKTGKALTRVGLSNAAKLHQAYSNDDDKVISIIISSCSLAETAQWKVRTNKEFGKELNICTLSSKTRTTKNGSGDKIGDFLSGLSHADDKDLPDILLMCAHSKRVKDDLLVLLKSQKRITGTNGRKFKFNLFFDEADKNIGLITDSLKKIRTLIDVDTGHTMDTYLNEVHFITATPSPPFWGALRKIGIHKLANFDIEFGKEITTEQRKRARKQYQSILTQPHIDFQGPASALDNIKMVMESDIIPPIGKNIQNIIFAPAENRIQTHNDVKEFYLENGYHVFIHNGPEKGIYDPSMRFKSLEQLNIEYNLDPNITEVRDTLRFWQEENTSASLAITGWYTITRGLTFNTNGFNFTHMIFSWCHAKKLAEFVQLLGRCCGHADYCDPIKLIGPKQAFESAQFFVKNLLDLKEENVEQYDEKSFKKNKANEAITYEIFNNWQDARKRVTSIHPRCNPFNIGRKNESLPTLNNEGFYTNTLRDIKQGIMEVTHIINNRAWGINKNNKYRIHPGYTDITNKNTCKWIVCYRKEEEPIQEEKTSSVMDAFNKQ